MKTLAAVLVALALSACGSGQCQRNYKNCIKYGEVKCAEDYYCLKVHERICEYTFNECEN